MLGWIILIAISLVAFFMFVRHKALGQTERKRNAPETACFFHPELGFGGAERLVIDAALGLNVFGDCDSIIVTTHRDPKRCFDEVKPRNATQVEDGARVSIKDFGVVEGSIEGFYPQVIVCGSLFPRAVFGCFTQLCQNIAMTWAIIWMTLFGPEIDAFFVDQLSFPVLVLRILYGPTFRIMFYCHFPDSLCDPNKPFDALCLLEEQEERAPLSLYTKFLNYIDKYCMACADTIVYNSDFTKCVTEKCFGTDFDGKTLVLRPAFGLRTKRRTLTISDQTCSQLNMLDNFTKLPPALTSKSSKTFCIVCISCFEPRKNHILALQMLEHIFAVQKVLAKKGVRKNPPKVHLVLAGGYDSRRLDNVRCMRSLLEAINENTRQHVSILPNISDDLKWGLLHRADAVVFTPVNEPFGIVPLEAMSCGKPVIACNFGGPVETIGLTHEHGILLDPDPEKFAEAMLVLINNEKLRHEMGWDAQEHVEDEFILQDLCGNFWFHLFED